MEYNVSRSRLFRWVAWFSFANTFFLLLIAFRYLHLMDWPSTWVAQLFTVLALPGHFVTVAMVPLLVVSVLIILLPRAAFIRTAALILSSIIVITLLIDAFIFGLYRFHLNGMVWSLISNGGITEIIPFSWVTWSIIILIVGTVISLEVALSKMIWSWVTKEHCGGKPVFWVCFCVVLSGQVLHAWGDANNYTEITKQVRYFPAYKPVTMKRALRKFNLVAAEGIKIKQPNVASGLAYPLQSLACQFSEPEYNILLITIDSWRFDMMDQKTTPHIWDFSQQSSQYLQHYSTGNATRFGIFGLFYGIYGTYWHAMLAEERGPLLIDELLNKDYQFAIHASARLTNPEFDRTVFSAIRDQIQVKTPGRDVVERDQHITKEFLTFLRQRDVEQPFFGFLFYDGPHGYQYPEQADAPFQPVVDKVNHLSFGDDYDPAPLKNRFLNAVHYVDSLIGQILDHVKQQGLLDNTIVLITGDHGEEFNETGQNYWGHNSNFTRYQSQTPLLVSWPGQVPENWSHLTSHLDVAPTLLKNALGCTAPLDSYSNGLELTNTQQRDFLLLSGWDRFGILTPGRIDLVYNIGHIESYDENNRPISTPMDNQIMLKAMQRMSQFYEK